MRYNPICRSVIVVSLVGGLAFPVAAQDTSFGVAPSLQSRSALQSLSREPAFGFEPGPSAGVDTPEVMSIRVPATLGEREPAAVDPVLEEMPFAVSDTMVLTLSPDIDQESLAALIEERDLEVLETYENLNAIHVQVDLSEFFQTQLGDDDASAAMLRGVLAASESFKKDPRVIGASPDLLLAPQDVQENKGSQDSTASVSPIPQVETYETLSQGETQDWGVADIEADALWSELGAHDGALMAVMDTGFNRHEDLVFMALRSDEALSDHGNHVAGIACSRHNDIGMRGVLPNCFVLPRSGDFYPIANEGGDILRFMTRFSMIMSTLDQFVADTRGARVYNVSLGYNWAGNFGMNIDDPEHDEWRQVVAMQGENLLNALVFADRRGAIIVSAAGNDSRNLDPPMQAKFASPFNWAAFEARSRGLASSGLVVEAHDQDGNRAAFSNAGGDLSCPGVNVLSAVARDASGQPAQDAYGRMSGTSMASPYCAAGAVLLSLIRPNYTGSELVECLLESDQTTDSGAPRLKLTKAMAACPPHAQ